MKKFSFLFVSVLLLQAASAATITSTGAGGNWNATGSWVGSVVPTSTDDVVIADGATITVNVTTAACKNLQVGQGTSGRLTYVGSTTAATLTVNGDINVKSGATFDAGTGTGSGAKKLNLGGSSAAASNNGSLIVDGTFDMGTTGESSSVTPTALLTFFGSGNATISGSGSTCRFNSVVVNKGTDTSSIVEATRVFTMRSPGGSSGSSRLTLASGSLKISSASSITPYYSSETICASIARLWLNNSSASVSAVSAGVPTVTGVLQADAGTFTYGGGSDNMALNGGLIIGGGTVTMNGRITFGNNSVFTMTSGNLNIDPQAASSVSSSSDIVAFGTSSSNTVTINFTGGTLTIVDPHAAASSSGLEFVVTAINGTFNFAGSNIKFGDGTSTTAGSSDGFELSGGIAVLGNVIVNNTTSNPSNRFVRLGGNTTIGGTLTINNAQSELKLNGKTLSLSGSLTNNGTFTGNEASSALQLNGSSSQSLTIGTYTSSVLTGFTVNNSSGVTLNAPLNVSTLNMTSGILTVTSTNYISVTGTTAASVTGGSSTSYVSGPLKRSFASGQASGSTFTFPVGKGAYQLFELVNPTTSATGTVTVEVFDANAGGTAGFGLTSLNTNRYWSASTSSSFISSTSVRLTEGTLSGANRIGQSSTLTGTYISRGGGSTSPMLSNSVSPVNTSLGYFVLGNGTENLAAGTYTVGADGGNTGTLFKLTDVANLLNSWTVTGNIIFEMKSDYDGTTGETLPITFNQFVTSGGNWTATIRVASGVSTRTTSGDAGSANSLIVFNGGDHIIFDGRAGGSGSTIAWLFRNTRASATIGPVFKFINDAIGDYLTYVQIEGGAIGTANVGTILIGSTTGTTGNDSIVVSHCSIRDRSDVSAVPELAICNYGSSTAGKENNDVTISDNGIFNFKTSGVAITGNGSGNNWTITGNSFYSTVTATGTQTVLDIDPGSGYGNYLVSGNYIGGSAASCGGSAWTTSTTTGTFTGIALSTDVTNASSVQGNTIQNISMTGTSTCKFVGISINAGKTNVGTVTGNTIGSASAANSIQVAGASYTRGIVISPGTASSTVENVSNNTVANLSATGTGLSVSITGIYSDGGSNTISNNTVFKLSSAGNNTGTGDNATVIGISEGSTTTAAAISVAHNTIHSLSATHASAAVNVIGLYFTGHAYATTNSVSANFIHSFSTSSSSTTSQQIGINAGVGNCAYFNNMIRLGIDAAGSSQTVTPQITGIDETAGATSNDSFYHNSVYIGGTGVGTGSANTAAFRKTSSLAQDVIKNNVFMNVRSNGSTGGKHYGIYVGSSPASYITSDYNVIYATGTGTVFGYNGSDKSSLSAWITATSQDAHSISADPNFVNATGNSSAVDLHVNTNTPVEATGTLISSVTDDYDSQSRASYTPTDIGADAGNFTTCLAPSVTIQPSNQSACTSSNATFTIVSSGTPLTYQWQESANGGSSWSNITNGGVYSGALTASLTLTGVTSGMNTYQYHCIVTASCLPASETSNAGVLTVNSLPTASITSQTDVSCYGGINGSATVTGSGGTSPYAYIWGNAATTQTASALSTGTYSVTVTDANGCTVTTSAIIAQPSALSGSIASTDETCHNNTHNGTLTASFSGGTGSYIYSWSTSPVQTSATATRLYSGTYSVTITDANGCQVAESQTVGYTENCNYPDLGDLGNYAILAQDSIYLTTSYAIYVNGKAGASVPINPLLTAADGNEINTSGFSNAVNDLIAAKNFCSSQSGTSVISDDLRGETLEEGVYNISGDWDIDTVITLEGDSNSVFIFNVSGSLYFHNLGTIRVEEEVRINKIFFNVSNSLTFDSLNIAPGVFLVNGIVTMSGYSYEEKSLFGLSSINFIAPQHDIISFKDWPSDYFEDPDKEFSKDLFASRYHSPNTTISTTGNGSNVGDPRAQVNISSTDATDVRVYPLGYGQSEPSIAINHIDPDNILISANTNSTPLQNGYSRQGYYYSLNGGTSWAGDGWLPNNGPGNGDPVACFDASGNGYLVTVGPDVSNFPYAQEAPYYINVQKTDVLYKGTTWNTNPDYWNLEAFPFQTAGDKYDREHATFDRSSSSLFKNNFYLVWTIVYPILRTELMQS